MRRRYALAVAFGVIAAAVVMVVVLRPHDAPGRHAGAESVAAAVSATAEPASAQEAPTTDATQKAAPTRANDERRQPGRTPVVGSGHEKLAAALGLRRAESTPATEIMRKYTARELDLLARVQRATGGEVPAGVLRVIEMRRAGAGHDALCEESDTVLAGDLLARAAVVSWLAQQYDAPARAEAAEPKPDEKIKIGGRLRKVIDEPKPAAADEGEF